jgi:hypothetical protein
VFGGAASDAYDQPESTRHAQVYQVLSQSVVSRDEAFLKQVFQDKLLPKDAMSSAPNLKRIAFQ